METTNEATYNFGKEEYTKKNLTPTDILDLAYAYSQSSVNKIIGNKLDSRIKSANDLARLLGSTQMDPKSKSGKPALILHLLKNSLVTKDEYIKLYKDLIQKHISVVKALKNSSPERRHAGGAARAAAKDMKGEFGESVNEENKSPEEILRGLREMAMGDLERIEDYAEMIADRMEQGQELSSWMYSQITLAVDQLNSVHDAMDGNDGIKESVNEASMSDIDIIAQEARDFKNFVKEFFNNYKDFPKTRESLKWLEDIYKGRTKMEGLDKDGMERVASGLPQTQEEN